ncbi:MAG: hypothetical protein HC853_00120 [Anaerolineae bacterium]|nr:hypothetical protein [Anaerolineae bacterium]
MDEPKLWDVLCDHIPIEEVAARYAQDGHIKPNGQGWRCKCVCGRGTSRRPNVQIYKDGDAHCFTCGQHFGDVIALYQAANGIAGRWQACQAMRDEYAAHLPVSQAERGRKLAPAVRPPLQNRTSTSKAEHQIPRWALWLLEITVAHYQEQLANAPEVQAYLRDERGLSDETIRRMRIGYCPGSNLRLALHRQGGTYNWEGQSIFSRAESLGLLTEHGEFMRQRIVIPTLDAEGAPVFLSGRATQAWQKEIKYLNLPMSEALVRQPMVWGKPQMGVILVEGPMDAAALLEWEVDDTWQVICLFGVGLDTILPQLLSASSETLHKPRVILSLDQDTAGVQAACSQAKVLDAQRITCCAIVDRDQYVAVRTKARRMRSLMHPLRKEDAAAMEDVDRYLLSVRDLVKRNQILGSHFGGCKDLNELLMRGQVGRAAFAAALNGCRCKRTTG